MASRSDAPGELEMLRRFVNTLNVEDATDALDTPAGLHAWLTGNDLLDPGEKVTARDRREAVAVREALRALLLANNGAPLVPAAFDALNAAATRARLEARFVPPGVAAVAPRATGVAGALGRLLHIAHEAMADGTWERLKACSDDACHWAFYDHSRNASGRWCSMQVCGNRNKGRTFRARHRISPAGTG
jgi:predicted RNA-binding Zn ribbon-like protein